MDPCPPCSTESPYVFWSDACIPFAVQRDGSAADDISASMLEALVEDGFRVWSEVPCPRGGTPELAAGSQGPIACAAVEYNCQEPDANSNVIMFRDAFVDRNPGLHFGVIALTTLTANLNTGELYDADIEINSRDEAFALDGESGVSGGQARDLRGVVNHELGHLLGLSHSSEDGALMRPRYEGTTEPGADDIEAICEALGASETDPVCNTTELGAEAGCVGSVGSDAGCTSITVVSSEPRGCACRFAGAPGSAASGGPSGGGLAWAAALVAIQGLRHSRRRRSVL